MSITLINNWVVIACTPSDMPMVILYSRFFSQSKFFANKMLPLSRPMKKSLFSSPSKRCRCCCFFVKGKETKWFIFELFIYLFYRFVFSHLIRPTKRHKHTNNRRNGIEETQKPLNWIWWMRQSLLYYIFRIMWLGTKSDSNLITMSIWM